MQALDTSRLAYVEAALNYLDPAESHPAYYLYEPVAGELPPRPAAARHSMPIHDLRGAARTPNLDDNGFAIVQAASATRDFFDPAQVTGAYYAECAELVRVATGASTVHVFDHNVRDQALAEQAGAGVREPVRFVHNDYTERSGPQRVRDLFGAAATALLEQRFVFINVWRPLRGPVLDLPLAVCDAPSLASGDFIATDLKYADRTGEVYSVRHNPAHRWFYLAHMQPHEALLLKCYDSANDGRARYTAHSAFRDPTAPPDAATRQSIEVRTIAFFGAA